MTARPNSNSGGRIPPDGRGPQTPGVGRSAKRHDMERPKTPGLHGSDLQIGDVSALEQGQRISPLGKQQQAPAQSQRKGAPRRRETAGLPAQQGTPEPLGFLSGRLRGTRGRPTGKKYQSRLDEGSHVELMRRLATNTGASGILGQAYITKMQNLIRTPQQYETPLLDMQDADEALRNFLDARP